MQGLASAGGPGTVYVCVCAPDLFTALAVRASVGLLPNGGAVQSRGGPPGEGAPGPPAHWTCQLLFQGSLQAKC